MDRNRCPTESRGLLDQALEVHARLGADRDTARVTSRLRTAAVREGVRIAALLTRGLTDVEIAAKVEISPCTAEGHVHSTLAKLGVSPPAHRPPPGPWPSSLKRCRTPIHGLAQEAYRSE